MGSAFAERTPRSDASPTRAQGPSRREATAGGSSRFEDEADRAAARVLARTDPGASRSSVLGSLNRRASQGHRFLDAPVRSAGRANDSRTPDGRPPADGSSLLPKTGGHPLPQALGRQMGEVLGADLSGVRVHTGEAGKSVSTAHDHAYAVASGRNLFFSEGMYKPDDRAGRALLAHEVAHTVHQGAVPMAGGAPDSGLSAGGARLAGPQRSGGDRPTSFGNQTRQLVGGTHAAARFVTGRQTEEERSTPPTDTHRIAFGNMLQSFAGRGGDWTQYERNMMRGQNARQTRANQSMPPSTIPLFQEQLRAHEALDLAGAPSHVHHQTNIGYHQRLRREFGSQGYWSGALLHGIGAGYSRTGAFLTHPATQRSLEAQTRRLQEAGPYD